MVNKVGIIGCSEGNGHPFSFSAIINGYSDKGFKNSGWHIIHNYLKLRKKEEFCFSNMKVTHAWTQDLDITKKLCAACYIDNSVDDFKDMIGEVDAVIIARDDWQTHNYLAKPFLEAGLKVFIDKPLSLNLEELLFFKKYLKEGKLMSCAGLRYAHELDEVREDVSSYGNIRAARGAVIMNWEKYGIHILEAMMDSMKIHPKTIIKNKSPHESFAIETDEGIELNIDCLGDAPKTFHIDIIGNKKKSSHDLYDNFTAFRRMLKDFSDMLDSKAPAIDPDETLLVMKTIIAGNMAEIGGVGVNINDIKI